MGCLSLAFLEQLIVWGIILIAVVSIIKLVVPWLAGIAGIPILGQVVNIILWAVVAIVVVYIIFALLSCLLGAAGSLHLPRL